MIAKVWKDLKNMRMVRDEIERAQSLKILDNLGFRRVEQDGNSSCLEIFVNEKLGLVVKRNYLISERNKFCVPSFVVDVKPTEFEIICSKLLFSSPVLIQPFVDTTESLWAYNYIEENFRDSIIHADLHCGNCGFYLNIPYLFDW